MLTTQMLSGMLVWCSFTIMDIRNSQNNIHLLFYGFINEHFEMYTTNVHVLTSSSFI